MNVSDDRIGERKESENRDEFINRENDPSERDVRQARRIGVLPTVLLGWEDEVMGFEPMKHTRHPRRRRPRRS